MVVKLDSKRRLTLPKTLTSTEPGDQFEMSFDQDENVVILRRIPRRNTNWFETLKKCPVRLVGDLPPRPREYYKSKL